MLVDTDRILGMHSHAVAVDVVTREKTHDVYTVETVFLGGADILWMEEDGFGDYSGNPLHYTTLSQIEFEARLAEEMVVPAYLLKVTYDFKTSAKTALLFP